jgi:hypothetical protein
MIDNDKWYESLGENVNNLAQTYLHPIEKGRMIEVLYKRFLKEAERDAREQRNKEQYHE